MDLLLPERIRNKDRITSEVLRSETSDRRGFPGGRVLNSELRRINYASDNLRRFTTWLRTT